MLAMPCRCRDPLWRNATPASGDQFLELPNHLLCDVGMLGQYISRFSGVDIELVESVPGNFAALESQPGVAATSGVVAL